MYYFGGMVISNSHDVPSVLNFLVSSFNLLVFSIKISFWGLLEILFAICTYCSQDCRSGSKFSIFRKIMVSVFLFMVSPLPYCDIYIFSTRHKLSTNMGLFSCELLMQCYTNAHAQINPTPSDHCSGLIHFDGSLIIYRNPSFNNIFGSI